MRWMLVLLVLIPAALLAKPQPAPAQAAVAAYPWCLQYVLQGTGKRNCYYSTREQCLYDARPIGGYCIQSPYYGRPQPPGFAGPEALSPGAPYHGPEARYSAEPTGAPQRPPAHRRHHHHS
jgi:Protein of unknown function (DUF3551)